MRAHRRWPGGIYALWYPIKDRAAVARFREELEESGIPKILDIAFEIRPPSRTSALDGSGLVVVNPPFVFENEMRMLLPELEKILAEDRQARWSLDWITGENAARLTATAGKRLYARPEIGSGRRLREAHMHRFARPVLAALIGLASALGATHGPGRRSRRLSGLRLFGRLRGTLGARQDHQPLPAIR